MGIQKRNIAVSIILYFVTCGIYIFYWMYMLTEESNYASGENGFSGGMVILLSLVTCGLFTYYWFYKLGDNITKAKAARGMSTDSYLGVIYLVLAFFGLGIVSYALAQNELNQMA